MTTEETLKEPQTPPAATAIDKLYWSMALRERVDQQRAFAAETLGIQIEQLSRNAMLGSLITKGLQAVEADERFIAWKQRQEAANG
jgi:hypothetical protein